MKKIHSIDIDDMEDLVLAESLLLGATARNFY